MGDWNWLQILGFALLMAGGFTGFILGLILLSSLFLSCPGCGTAIFIALMLLIGACLWFFGKKKGGEK